MAHLNPCWKCKGTDIKIWDCGYSSFNVGGVKCNTCTHEVKLDICDTFPEAELARAWNNDKDNFLKQKNALTQRVQEMEDTLKNPSSERQDLMNELVLFKLNMEARLEGSITGTDPTKFDLIDKELGNLLVRADTLSYKYHDALEDIQIHVAGLVRRG